MDIGYSRFVDVNQQTEKTCLVTAEVADKSSSQTRPSFRLLFSRTLSPSGITIFKGITNDVNDKAHSELTSRRVITQGDLFFFFFKQKTTYFLNDFAGGGFLWRKETKKSEIGCLLSSPGIISRSVNTLVSLAKTLRFMASKVSDYQ